MNQGWIYRDLIPAAAVGQTLLDYYAQRYRHSSRAEWQQRIEAGQVTVDEGLGRAEQPLQAGQQLAYHRPPWQEPAVPLEFAVLYEDDDFLAIAKPSGLPVLPGGGFLEHTLLHQLRQRYRDPLLSPAHRLGRGTSGVMLWARSPLAKSELSRQMRRSTYKTSPDETSSETAPAAALRKTYRALVGPGELPDRLLMTTPIGPVPYPQLGTIHAATPMGKPARSAARVVSRCDAHTLLDVTIFTGRPHQIRIHLAAAGYPLLHDPLYAPGGQPYPVTDAPGAVPVPGDCGYWLHAHRLQLHHPRTRSPLNIVAPPPPPLQSPAERVESNQT